ncbi:radical SAM protein [Vibrio breoganii]
MLMGTEFYLECHAFLERHNRTHNTTMHFTIQSNILLYNNKWRAVLDKVFKSGLSTSYEYNNQLRTVKGSAEIYSRLFESKLAKLKEDGITAQVIYVFNNDNINDTTTIYNENLNSTNPHNIRINYMHPEGRAKTNNITLLDPERYTAALLTLYDRWITDCPAFNVSPLEQLLRITAGDNEDQCPWTSTCVGSMLSVEPNGDVYNCPDFQLLDNGDYCFGNIFNDTIGQYGTNIRVRDNRLSSTEQLMLSAPAKKLYKRRIKIPPDCIRCKHYRECKGGCMKEILVYEQGLGGKFHYCHSWYHIIARIKESILSGEADNILTKLNIEPTTARRRVKLYE